MPEPSAIEHARTPLLSVCIPTHNGRRKLLREALESVITQIGPGLEGRVELCVSDNASSDGTAEMIEEYRRSGAAIRYRRHPTDLGAIHNIFSAIELATGRFCWALMSDDALAPGALSIAVETLDRHPDLTGLNVNYACYDGEMKDALAIVPEELSPPADHGPIHYTDYRRIVIELGLLMTNDIFIRRDTWNAIVLEHGERLRRISPTFVYVIVLAKAAEARPRWLWIPDVLLHWRIYTSSWVEEHGVHGTHLRWMRDVTPAFREISAGDPETYRILLRKWIKLCLDPATVAGWKLFRGFGWRDDLELLATFTARLWRVRSFWTGVLPILLTPAALLRSSRWTRRRFRVLEQPWHVIDERRWRERVLGRLRRASA